jgi:hypothetical protein
MLGYFSVFMTKIHTAVNKDAHDRQCNYMKITIFTLIGMIRLIGFNIHMFIEDSSLIKDIHIWVTD